VSPPSFPLSISVSRQPLRSTGSLGSVPLLRRYYELLRRPPSITLRFVSFARRYRLATELAGSPRFLENPCVRAPLYDPDEIAANGPIELDALFCRRDVASGNVDTVGSRDPHLSGFHDAAHTLAVYASQCEVALAPRKTRFRLVAHLGRTTLATARAPNWVPS